MKFKRDKKLDRLYDAAADYIKSVGGTPVVIGGVSISQDPSALKFNFQLVINWTGKLPVTPETSEGE